MDAEVGAPTQDFVMTLMVTTSPVFRSQASQVETYLSVCVFDWIVQAWIVALGVSC
jgi:hypothetical protein